MGFNWAFKGVKNLGSTGIWCGTGGGGGVGVARTGASGGKLFLCSGGRKIRKIINVHTVATTKSTINVLLYGLKLMS